MNKNKLKYRLLKYPLNENDEVGVIVGLDDIKMVDIDPNEQY